MTFLENLLILIGRILISAFVFWSIAEKVRNWQRTTNFMKLKRVPQVHLVLPLAVLLQALAALMILVGFMPRLGALILIIFLVPSAIRFHDFWTLSGPERTADQTLFMKDVAIVGGLLFVLALGGGHFGFN